LAVIIILAVIALIATPIVLNVVDSAKAKANEASIQGYGDALKLAVYEKQFENQGKIPSIDKDWALTNVKQGGNEVVCSEVYYSENYGPVLHEYKVDGSDDTYYLGNKKIYTDPNNLDYKEIYESVSNLEVVTGECTYGKELVQGAEFIYGQYKYHYMQQSDGYEGITSGWQKLQKTVGALG